MIRFFAVLIGIFIANTASAQPDLLWSQTYGGESSEYCNSVIQTADGGFVLAGSTWSFGEGCDMWLIVTDDEGDSLWSQTYGGEDYDACNAVIQTPDGGFALAGRTMSFGEGGIDFWLLRTDEEGEELWSQTYGGDSLDGCSSVIQTADGGFALAGYTTSVEGYRDGWLIVTDREGEELWSQTYGGREDDYFDYIIQTASGGFALAGYTNSFGAGEYDFWLVRTDEEGEELWSQTYGGESSEYCNSVIQTAAGGFSLAGRTNSFGAGEYDFWLLRTDEEGEELWSQTYGGENSETCGSLILTDNGGYALGGSTRSFGAGEYDFWLVKTGPDPVSVPESDFVLHPSSFTLSPPYPNPFNSQVQVGYQAPHNGFISLKVYDQAGRSVASLFEGRVPAGKGALMWDAAGFPTGVYIVKLSSPSQTFSRKLALVK